MNDGYCSVIRIDQEAAGINTLKLEWCTDVFWQLFHNVHSAGAVGWKENTCYWDSWYSLKYRAKNPRESCQLSGKVGTWEDMVTLFCEAVGGVDLTSKANEHFISWIFFFFFLSTVMCLTFWVSWRQKWFLVTAYRVQSACPDLYRDSQRFQTLQSYLINWGVKKTTTNDSLTLYIPLSSSL